MIKIPVEVSARHLHLSQKDLETVFGIGYQLKKKKDLSQPSDFAAEEFLNLKNGNKIIKGVRVVGPVRKDTQVEISKTDAFYLGINPPVKLSGDIDGTPGITLIGPKGEINLEKGLIIAERHIHCATDEAKKLKLKKGVEVSVKIESERPVTFHNIKIRIRDDYKFCLHIDTDEGNAAGINKIGKGVLIIPAEAEI